MVFGAAAGHNTSYTATRPCARYVEHKLELDGIRAAAEKMQRQLDDTHKQLAAEVAKRFTLEEAGARARLEAGRAGELAAQLAAERSDRIKLEKEYLELQGRAFAAPGSAMAEVRQLREELFGARRERALGEAREADLRREMAALRRQVGG
ncbi:hypothetical protein MNEG_13838 [Monoraphidium neglectum]|uniref:Uncharacterized protein n=1 Tax=Monoraphidium neglectum TaxID=145388 RepID=A0A0D2MGD3_9CHLO|nr:hypothetical protein MNEG_13838 [Monoraphidium neglectum]KIY94125.1 hypothetical protein MNEG_13838 [Monoraphidium neglectum]|eukprot:XP_013893145.1 hypothetical protein MNEG_13838 [Monoraphidium neglectum]